MDTTKLHNSLVCCGRILDDPKWFTVAFEARPGVFKQGIGTALLDCSVTALLFSPRSTPLFMVGSTVRSIVSDNRIGVTADVLLPSVPIGGFTGFGVFEVWPLLACIVPKEGEEKLLVSKLLFASIGLWTILFAFCPTLEFAMGLGRLAIGTFRNWTCGAVVEVSVTVSNAGASGGGGGSRGAWEDSVRWWPTPLVGLGRETWKKTSDFSCYASQNQQRQKSNKRNIQIWINLWCQTKVNTCRKVCNVPNVLHCTPNATERKRVGQFFGWTSH